LEELERATAKPSRRGKRLAFDNFDELFKF